MEGDQSTMLVVMLIVGLVVGTGAGYFLAAPSDTPTPEPATPTQPTVRPHNHLGIWTILIALLASRAIRITRIVKGGV